MRKEARFVCLITCAAGAFGMFLRWLNVSSAFDTETGLAARGAVSGYALVLFCFAAAMALAVFARGMKGVNTSVPDRFALRGKSIIYPFAAAAFGILMLAGAVLLFVKAGETMYPALKRILAILAAACGASFPAIAIGPKKNSNGALSCLASLVPVAFFCFWLILSYKENSANPVLWSYGIEILAISSAVLGFYYAAGYIFGRIRPQFTVFFCQLGAFLCIVTLADDRPFYLQFLFFAAAGMLLILSATLMCNFEHRKREWLNIRGI